MLTGRLGGVLVYLIAGQTTAAPVALGVPGTSQGVVTTSEPTAARVGAEILRRGGNAIDAAAAVQFALNVVEPESSGIGGGGFMMIHLSDQNKTLIVDSRETAPAASTPDMFMLASEPEQTQSFAMASTSGISVGVPGTVLGVATALDKWGTITLAEALAPAIRLAEEGIRVGPDLAKNILSDRLSNEPGNPAFEEARRVFRPGAVPLKEGELLRQPELAKTLRMLAKHGPEAFYRGEIARAIVSTQRHGRAAANAQDSAKLTGRMTLEDLAGYRVAVREPVVGRYRGFTIKSMGPPSSGGLSVIQILKLLERFPIGDTRAGYGFGSVRTLNVMIEAMRLTFADRAMWMGDADFVELPTNALVDDEYIKTRSALIEPGRRLTEVSAGDPRPFAANGGLRGEKFGLGDRMPEPMKGLNTTHFTIIDGDGNIVSYTSTIESAWGTGLMVTGFGFLLNNELTDFNFKPRSNSDPQRFDPGANDAAPHKRPRSSMAPTMLFQGDRPVAAYGSPGGPTIIGSVVNVTMNLVDHEMSVQEAVDAPRIAQIGPNRSLLWEVGFPEETLKRLKVLGYGAKAPVSIGSVQAIVVSERHGTQYGAADRRRFGAALSVARISHQAPTAKAQ